MPLWVLAVSPNVKGDCIRVNALRVKQARVSTRHAGHVLEQDSEWVPSVSGRRSETPEHESLPLQALLLPTQQSIL